MKKINLFKGKFGLEKEAVRVDKNGLLSSEKHPHIFSEENPYITKDFAEAQIEMITPPLESIPLAINYLEDIQTIVLQNIGDELLWGQSNPPHLPEGEIPVATFDDVPEKMEYRQYLSQKYGKEKSIISGVHFNYSADDSLINYFYERFNMGESRVEYQNNLYLKLAKYLLKDRWFLIYLTNASPVFHESYYEHCVQNSQQLESGDCIIHGMNSLRNSQCGYRNIDEFNINYESLQEYNQSVDDAVDSGKIQQASELYTPIRIKKNAEGNIEYLELRFLDVYPFNTSGISEIDLSYIHLYMVYALHQQNFEFNLDVQKEASKLHDFVTNSRGKEICIHQEKMNLLHQHLVDFYQDIQTPYDLDTIFASVQLRIDSESHTYAEWLRKEYAQSSYLTYHLAQANLVKEEALIHPFTFKSYPKLELSTKILIQEAIRQGFAFEVWDEASNFIEITDPMTGQKERIQQATKTNADRYANILSMENKLITKKMLNAHNIRVPEGIEIKSPTEVPFLDFTSFVSNGVVIKPNSTNFGIGITIYPTGATRAQIEQAITYAFTKDDIVLVESFLKGKEYRFLVIDNEVIGILHRRAANVVGDGKKTIAELIETKNQHPYRNKGYVTPLEYMELGKIEAEFLENQGLNFESIPAEGDVVFLRENSNISTGGDSIDVTDAVHPSYFDIATQATKAMDVAITGVDMMIEDISKPATQINHGIIELNFNPAIHIHTYPLEGSNRHPAEKILQLLFRKEGVRS